MLLAELPRLLEEAVLGLFQTYEDEYPRGNYLWLVVTPGLAQVEEPGMSRQEALAASEYRFAFGKSLEGQLPPSLAARSHRRAIELRGNSKSSV